MADQQPPADQPPPDAPLPPDVPGSVPPPADTTAFGKHFTDGAFWTKVKQFAGKLGRNTLQKAMEMYHVATAADTPLWAKAVAIGSLGYLILPFDAIPDILPIAGLTDDAAALAAAAAALVKNITPALKAKATEQVNKWLGPDPRAAATPTTPEVPSPS